MQDLFIRWRVGLACVLFAGTGWAQTTISVTPQQISLAAPAGSAIPIVQTLTVMTTGQSSPYTAAVRYVGAADWLSVSPATGTPPATLTITADASHLGPGNYFAQVTIAAGLIGTYANVLLVVDPGAGAIEPRPSGDGFFANPSALTFIGSPGIGRLPAQTIAVGNAKGASVAAGFTAVANSASNWLSIGQSFPNTTPGTLTVIADQSALSAGTYTGTITISAIGGGSTTVVPVVLAAADSSAFRPALTVSQRSLTINHQIGTAAPPLQAVGVTATGAAPLLFSATTVAPWLSLTSFNNPVPSSSLFEFLPGQFNLGVDPTGLVPGTYAGVVDVTATGLPDLHLPVSFTVTGSPALNASPSSIFFDGFGVNETAVTLTATGNANLSFTAVASPGSSWLSVTPVTGSTAGGSQVITVRANPASLGPGTYTGSIGLSVAGGTGLTLPVFLNVTGAATSAFLDVPATPVALSGVVGLANPSQTVTIGTLGGAVTSVDFTAASSSTDGWLNVAPFLGTTSGLTPATVTITANSAAVPPGNYTGSVSFTALPLGTQMSIPVSFSLLTKAIMATPPSLSFAVQQKGVAPAPQTIQIAARSSSLFTVRTQATWIKVNPSSGSAGGPGNPPVITVSVDPSGFPSGTQSGNLVVTGPDNELLIPVILTIPTPALAASPAAIAFSHELGSPSPAPQSISLSSTFDSVRFTAAAATESGVKWLVVDTPSGTTPGTVRASVNTALLVPGKHTGSITIGSPDASLQTSTIPVALTVTAPLAAIDRMLHEATRAPTPLAPGLLLTITGAGLGPVTAVTARPNAAGAYETRLEGIRVLFDGVPAPVLFVGFDQIRTIVPYGLYGRVSARIQVEQGTSLSVPIEAKVVDAAPGIFVTSATGRGQAVAANADATPNSLANPAPRGSVISILGTGEGQTSPPGQDGRIIGTDLRRPLLPVTARIAGRAAEVTYAGSAPEMVSGVLWVNVRIPEDIPSGSVPVELQVGEAVTQLGVTIAVR